MNAGDFVVWCTFGMVLAYVLMPVFLLAGCVALVAFIKRRGWW